MRDLTRLQRQPNVRPLMEASDENLLLRQAQAGELGAFEKLVELHRDRVYGLALRMTRSEADAAEITQEVFLSAWRNLSGFKGENTAAFVGWLNRIAANQTLMRLRHRKVVSQIEASLEGPQFNERGSMLDEVADWKSDALGLTLDAELSEAIQLAADALPEEYRRVFLLKDVDGLSYEEIGDITGDSVPAIKSRLHRARLTMRSAIDAFYQDVESSD
ncbi:MAG: DNA-directed polymerase sigma-70 factor [Myxococcaceae bacterium]|nr:DNA-directed polymerase sigma-70 factor [Myxococcaceae bacterium]